MTAARPHKTTNEQQSTREISVNEYETSSHARNNNPNSLDPMHIKQAINMVYSHPSAGHGSALMSLRGPQTKASCIIPYITGHPVMVMLAEFHENDVVSSFESRHSDRTQIKVDATQYESITRTVVSK